MAEVSNQDADASVTARTGGGYRHRMDNVEAITVSDFYNPWNFYAVFMKEDSFVVKWCVCNGLIADEILCTSTGNCDGTMKLSKRSGRITGYTLRCNKNRNHECGSRRHSFFEKSKLAIQDIMVFIKTYIEGNTLYQCSRMSGVHYQSTGVDWGCFLRELFKEYFHRHIRNRKISGEIEIDESLFGRHVKHHRGNPKKGCKIWVFGMVERSSNTVILYPVRDRSEQTLMPLIERHVEKGSTIYSDGWSAYCSLNVAGYNHFSVIHKHTFKSLYRNLHTGENVTVHTNRIEGAWKHAKDHFKSIVGTKLSQFEGHLAEVMWHSEVKGKCFEPFFKLLKEVYTLRQPPIYTYSTPLFDSWDLNTTDLAQSSIGEWEVVPTITDIDESESNVTSATASEAEDQAGNVTHEAIYISSEHESDRANIPRTSASTSKRCLEKMKLISKLFSSTDTDDETNKTVTESRKVKPLRLKLKKKHHEKTKTAPFKKIAAEIRSDRVCHPKGYEHIPKYGRRKHTPSETPRNPYGKDAFVWSSSDSDFQ